MKLNRTSIVLGSAAALVIGIGGIAQAQDPTDTTTPTTTETTTETPDTTTTCDDFEGEVPSTDPAYHEGLDPDGDGVGCELDESPPVTETTTTEPTTTTVEPTTETTDPTTVTENHNEQSQTVVVNPPAERDTVNRTPLQSVPSGPIYHP